jgi:hypothetical protein
MATHIINTERRNRARIILIPAAPQSHTVLRSSG